LALASAGCSATGLLFLSDAAAEFESAVAGPVEPSIATLDERPIRGLHVLQATSAHTDKPLI